VSCFSTLSRLKWTWSWQRDRFKMLTTPLYFETSSGITSFLVRRTLSIILPHWVSSAILKWCCLRLSLRKKLLTFSLTLTICPDSAIYPSLSEWDTSPKEQTLACTKTSSAAALASSQTPCVMTGKSPRIASYLCPTIYPPPSPSTGPGCIPAF